MKRSNYLLKGLLSASLALAAGLAFGQDVTISTTVDTANSGDLITPGTRLRVLVEVSDNFTTGYEPSGASVVLQYPTDSLTWGYLDTVPTTPTLYTVEEAEDPDGAGPLNAWGVIAGSTETPGAGSVVSRRVSAVGEAIGLTPLCFYANFTVGGSGNAVPYDIDIASDPSSGNPVPYITKFGDPGFPAVIVLTPDYNNTGTQNVSVTSWKELD